jgi:hypothetical protein
MTPCGAMLRIDLPFLAPVPSGHQMRHARVDTATPASPFR